MISAVAEMYGIHPQTLRLYEREGLLKPSRTEGNTRLYTDEDLQRLEFILSLARDLGERLGTGAHLVALRRTRSGDLRLDQAIELRDLGFHALLQFQVPFLERVGLTPAAVQRQHQLAVQPLDLVEQSDRVIQADPAVVCRALVTHPESPCCPHSMSNNDRIENKRQSAAYPRGATIKTVERKITDAFRRASSGMAQNRITHMLNKESRDA